MRLPTAALLLVASACERRAPVRACSDSLEGVWVSPDGGRWMLLDHGPTIEGYPLFDDSVPDGAPRVIDLSRGDQLAGDIKRRFMRRAETCQARAQIRITACKDDSLQLVLGDVAPPLTYAPCSWGRPIPARVETWQRD